MMTKQPDRQGPARTSVDYARRIHITGASGSGTTTLGSALASRLDSTHLDTDYFFWEPTDPPFTTMRDQAKCLALLDEALADSPNCVLSGSLGRWANPLLSRFDLVVFLSLPQRIRVERLRLRETARFGSRIEPGGDMHENHQDFMQWAAGYDDGTAGRNRERHEQWLGMLHVPVIRLDSRVEVGSMLDQIQRRLQVVPSAAKVDPPARQKSGSPG